MSVIRRITVAEHDTRLTPSDTKAHTKERFAERSAAFEYSSSSESSCEKAGSSSRVLKSKDSRSRGLTSESVERLDGIGNRLRRSVSLDAATWAILSVASLLSIANVSLLIVLLIRRFYQ